MKAFATRRGWLTACFAIPLIVAAADVDAGSRQRPGPPPPLDPPPVTQIVDGTPRPFPLRAEGPAVPPPTGRAEPMSLAPPDVTSLLTITDEAGMASPLGGDDIVVSSSASFSTPFFQIASDGTAFVAVQSGQQLNVYRSTDGGETWPLWSTFEDPSYFVVNDFIVAEGTVDRAIVAYWVDTLNNQVRIAYADINAAVPAWTIVTVLASAGIEFGTEVDIATDAVDYAGYFVYLAARGDDGNGADIWFARSTTQGTSFAAGYRVASETGGATQWFGNPIVAYGDGDWIHLSYLDGSTTADEGLLQRRAVSWANAGLAAWEAPVTLEAAGNAQEVLNKAMEPRTVGGNVAVIMFMTSPGGWEGESRYSTDFGATWPGGNFGFVNVPVFGLSLLNMPTGSMAMLALGDFDDDDDPLQPVLTRALFTPDTWSVPEAFASHDWDMNYRTPHLAFDPTRGNRIAAVWSYQIAGNYVVRFDAEWRRDPGYPNTDVGFPVGFAGTGQTPPAVAEVDGDPEKEIVFATRGAGQIHVVNHDGTEVPGWPVTLGVNVPFDAPVAVGDITGNGEVAVVTGTVDGRVFAYDPDGELMPGWPISIGEVANTFVSIGAFGEGNPRDVVAVGGHHIGVYRYDGNPIHPSWGTFTDVISRPAAIGDVDDDGVTDVVTLKGPYMHVHSLEQAAPEYFRFFSGEVFSDAPTLADVDGDGTLEIAAPTVSGKMYLLNYDGTDYSPTWPLNVAPGVWLTSASLAQFVGTTDVDMTFAESSGDVHMIISTGVEQATYPKTTGAPAIFQPPILATVSATSSNISIGTDAGVGHSWRNTGPTSPGWPRNLPGVVEESLASGDIDNDGRNELIVLGINFLTVYDVGQPPQTIPRNHWPMYGYDAQRTGCLACVETFSDVGDAPAVALTGGLEIHPNPFNPATTITYQVARSGAVTLAVYDVHGRRVDTLIDGEHREPNRYSLRYEGRLASGVYFLRLVTSGEEFARKMVVLK